MTEGRRKPKKNKPRRIPVEERRTQVAKRYLELRKAGMFNGIQARIAAELEVSEATISDDMAAIEAEWKSVRLDAIDEWKRLCLIDLDNLEREVRAQWERSKDVALEVTEESPGKTKAGKDKPGKKTTKRRWQCGDPRYTDQLQRIWADRRKLLGLDAPTKQEMTGKDGAPLLSELTDEQRAARVAAILREAQKRAESDVGAGN